MKTTRYQILAEYIICGKACECLCDIPTASGNAMVVLDEESAKTRIAELTAIGKKARYEELPWGKAWWDDENWIG